MTKFRLLFSISLLLVIAGSSCRKDANQLTRQEQILVGKWKFTKEKFTKSIWTKDPVQLVFLQDATLLLTADRKVTLTDAKFGNEKTGTWELESNTYTNYDGTCTYNSNLVLALFDSNSQEVSSLVLENFSISKNTLRAITDEREGCYRHKLERAN